MKRVVEKVKDIVEVCPFTHLYDFAADPALTLDGYHFTDITADLMAKWLDRFANVRAGQGDALALAGFRGVGKSHFLAVMAAIVSRPDLRSRIEYSHVSLSADQFSRRHSLVAQVWRGSGDSLLQELRTAISQTLDVPPGDLGDSIDELLVMGSEKSSELPLVLLIDTAAGRDSRVARDDGPVLSEIAKIAKSLGIFVGVALDDDISGADGPNSSISGSFTIDFLDQEHLYKIVDNHIFSKHNRMLPVLHDIYEYYRSGLPGFRWSEQRFSSLYPLHPATLEIAPLIRLYIQDFALLGFASEAGVKILGRPANSLIGLDEVFDNVDKRMRAVPDLKEAFAAFDKLDREVIANMGVHFRLSAKLILKGLFLLSLDGNGSTPDGIAASMLIFGNEESGFSALDIRKVLDSFAKTLPGVVEKSGKDSPDAKYCFRLTAREDVSQFLAEAAREIPEETLWNILLRQAGEKFAGDDISTESGLSPTRCEIEWRGAIRRGEIVWDTGVEAERLADALDWVILVEPGNPGNKTAPDLAAGHVMIWKLAELKEDEKNTLRYQHLLQRNTEIRKRLGDGLSTAIHVHSIAAEKIWQRVFLRDSRLATATDEYRFAEDAASAHGLAQLLEPPLAPVFESRYPSHPEFSSLFDMGQLSGIIANFFAGAGANNPDGQSLAATFAFPLGLAMKHGDVYIPVPEDTSNGTEVVEAILNDLDSDASVSFPMAEVTSRLMAPPFGLTREARYLILAALVSRRQIEFVTSNGNRINHRSLDLKIIWEDIVGIARPLNEFYSMDRLLVWARLVTGNPQIRSIARPEDKQRVMASFSDWIAVWGEVAVLEKFESLPDEHLNAAIWKTASNLRKSFGVMSDAINALLRGDSSLEQCLRLIAELFSDSETEFEKKKSELFTLGDAIASVSLKNEVTTYVTLSEITDNPGVEDLRQMLVGSLRPYRTSGAPSENPQIETRWSDFKREYVDHYVEKHNMVVASSGSVQGLREILQSDDWAAFQNIASVKFFDQRYVSKANALLREIRQLHCEMDVREMLAARPSCGCAFSLSKFDRQTELHKQLKTIVDQGLEYLRTRIAEVNEHLSGAMLERLSGEDHDAISTTVKQLPEGIDIGNDLSRLSGHEIGIINLVEDGRSAGQHPAADFPALPQIQGSEWEHELGQLEIFADTKR